MVQATRMSECGNSMKLFFIIVTISRETRVVKRRRGGE